MITIRSGNTFTLILAFKNDTHAPATSLTPTITIYKVSDNSKVVDAQNMSEIGAGLYKYSYTSPATNEAYAVYADGGSTITTYRYQYRAFYVNAGNEDSITSIQTNSEYIKNEIDEKLDAKVSSAGYGNGGITQTIFVNDVDGTREGGVKVEVFSNPSMAEEYRITGNRFTDDAGQVVFNLNPGIYYLRASKAGKTFANPITVNISE